jgi:hypothetical protein
VIMYIGAHGVKVKLSRFFLHYVHMACLLALPTKARILCFNLL